MWSTLKGKNLQILSFYSKPLFRWTWCAGSHKSTWCAGSHKNYLPYTFGVQVVTKVISLIQLVCRKWQKLSPLYKCQMYPASLTSTDIFLTSPHKHMLWLIIRSASLRCINMFLWTIIKIFSGIQFIQSYVYILKSSQTLYFGNDLEQKLCHYFSIWSPFALMHFLHRCSSLLSLQNRSLHHF